MRACFLRCSVLFLLATDRFVRPKEDDAREAWKEQGGDDNFCQPYPTVVLERSKTTVSKNGSLVHRGLSYPVGSYRIRGNETHGCACLLRACLRKCCRKNEILGSGKRPSCIRLPGDRPVPDLVVDESRLAQEIREVGGISDFFVLVEGHMSCPENTGRYVLEPEKYPEDTFVVRANGTLETALLDFPPWTYCLDWKETVGEIVVLACAPREEAPSSATNEHPTIKVGIIVSIPFFVVTFLVYAVISELRNLYGKTLMCYVGCLVVAYCFLVLAKLNLFESNVCAATAFVIHFSFLASFFWLNVMCFDIWWTFGGFRTLQGSAKQRERKKFILYSIYAWGSASILTGVCAIMDFVPDLPKNLIKPQFGSQSCWFPTDAAKAVYFYGPMGVTVLCNICLFVSTALRIVRHKKDTARQLKGTDSRRHDDNKQWFNLYLKLFIVMGINWSMEIVSWLCEGSSQIVTYIWYITDLTNTLQGVIIFLIFVWKDKIKRLLLKRFGCHDRNMLSRNSTRSVYHSSASRTCTTAIPLQEKVNPYVVTENARRDGETSPPTPPREDSDCS